MSKEIDLIKNIIEKIDGGLYVNYDGNPKIEVSNELLKLLLKLDTPEIRYYFNNYKENQHLAELKAENEQLKAELEDWKDGTIIVKLCELERENEKLKAENKKYKNFFNDARKDIDELDNEIGKLHQQLKEKDKEIKHLKATDTTIVRLPLKELSEMQSVREERIKKEITHQICEKIRNKFPISKDDIPDETTYFLHELLDQIEKGEK